MEKHSLGFRRLHIDRKMGSLLSVFALLGIFLVISIVIATNTLSGLRSYASLQTHWTEARKEASFHLENYISSGDPVHRARLDSSLYLIEQAAKAREYLVREDVDSDSVRQFLKRSGAVEDDINTMVMTFELFHNFADFREAISQWVRSDSLIHRMKQVAAEVQLLTAGETLPESERERLIKKAGSLDDQLTDAQFKLAGALSSGTRLLNTLILWVSVSLGLILLSIGLGISLRFLKSIKKWRHTIEFSEQQYRSLFEQNPNPVFSATPAGIVTDGNIALEKLTGESMDVLSGKEFNKIIQPVNGLDIRSYFERAAGGMPTSYELEGRVGSGKKITAELTHLPIYVEGTIVGVYGIIRDLTARKDAEIKVKEQLEEKIHLLSEIHDRVKNNMALIIGLIQLQQESTDSDKVRLELESIRSRIHSIAMVHERLYRTESFSHIRIDEYIELIGETIPATLNMAEQRYSIDVDADEITFGIDKAVPFALLLNELLSSVFTAVSDKNIELRLSIKLVHREGYVLMTLRAEADRAWDTSQNGNPEFADALSSMLIDVLTKQLDATLTSVSADTCLKKYELRVPTESTD